MAFAAAHSASTLSVANGASLLASCLLYFGFYIYGFCLSNQLVGREEDRINKPDRVIASGQLSESGAKLRLGIALVLFPLTGVIIGGTTLLGFALAWQLIFLAYNGLGLHRHWATKNLVFISLGTIVLLAPAWHLGASLNAEAWRWIVVVSVTFGATLHLQDLRDIEGDRATGRRTLPIAFDEQTARRLIALSIASLPLIIHFTLFQQAATILAITIELVLAVLNVWTALRVISQRDAGFDHKTYMLHTYWFCLVVASAGLVL